MGTRKHRREFTQMPDLVLPGTNLRWLDCKRQLLRKETKKVAIT